jgi:hypothetical protein
VLVALSAPLDFEPLVAKVPDQPPDAVQAVVLLEDQDSVELPPLETLVGLALSETVGVAAVTETVTDWAAEPPAPEQVRVYLVAAVSAAVAHEPLVASPPLQPPEAEQDVAFAVDQVNVDALPLLTVVGLALNVTVGAGCVTVTVADCAALPPAPVQVTLKLDVEVKAPVECVPLRACAPDQAPDAMQDVALVEDQVSVELLPLEIELGLALSVTVGAGVVTVTVADWDAFPPAPLHAST